MLQPWLLSYELSDRYYFLVCSLEFDSGVLVTPCRSFVIFLYPYIIYTIYEFNNLTCQRRKQSVDLEWNNKPKVSYQSSFISTSCGHLPGSRSDHVITAEKSPAVTEEPTRINEPRYRHHSRCVFSVPSHLSLYIITPLPLFPSLHALPLHPIIPD